MRNGVRVLLTAALLAGCLRAAEPEALLAALRSEERWQQFAALVVPLAEQDRREAIGPLQEFRAELAQETAEQEKLLAGLARSAGLARVDASFGWPSRGSLEGLTSDIQDASSRELDMRRKDIILAGALAGLGVEYEANAGLVRKALSDWDTWRAAFKVVGLLHDDASVDELCRLTSVKDVWDKLYHPAAREDRLRSVTEPLSAREEHRHQAIVRLGQIASPRAHETLVRAAHDLGLPYLEEIGRALRNIGVRNELPEIEQEGDDYVVVAKAAFYFTRPRATYYPEFTIENEHERDLKRRSDEAQTRHPFLARFFDWYEMSCRTRGWDPLHYRNRDLRRRLYDPSAWRDP